MVFSSLMFLFIFFPLVFLCCSLLPLPIGVRNTILLVASLLFYAWGEPVYVLLMVLNILFNYVSVLIMDGTSKEKQRKRQLVLIVAVNLGLLVFFKYIGFLTGVISSILPVHMEMKGIALPVGISFYTFQALSYVIDVYRRKVEPQENLMDFALYITMFPQLVAGPIVKYTEIANQLRNRVTGLSSCSSGLERMILGLSKKVLLANNLGLLHTTIQGLAQRSVATTWLGAIAYTLQIYFDFSGYSDMAIGMGEILGFQFPENFNYPYVAKSITDFWRRWHMTLSGWFREYVYIPLGGNRVSVGRHIFNLLVVWLLTGCWHGAGWNFIFWGLYYGILLILEKYVLGSLLERSSAIVQHIYTLLLVTIGWVLFSNVEFSGMTLYLKNMIGIGAKGLIDFAFFYYLRNYLLVIFVGVLASTPVVKEYIFRRSERRPVFAAVSVLILLVLDIAFLVAGTYNPFLYFRF